MEVVNSPAHGTSPAPAQKCRWSAQEFCDDENGPSEATLYRVLKTPDAPRHVRILRRLWILESPKDWLNRISAKQAAKMLAVLLAIAAIAFFAPPDGVLLISSAVATFGVPRGTARRGTGPYGEPEVGTATELDLLGLLVVQALIEARSMQRGHDALVELIGEVRTYNLNGWRSGWPVATVRSAIDRALRDPAMREHPAVIRALAERDGDVPDYHADPAIDLRPDDAGFVSEDHCCRYLDVLAMADAAGMAVEDYVRTEAFVLPRQRAPGELGWSFPRVVARIVEHRARREA